MINRVNVDKFRETVENAKNDPSSSKKALKVEGTWRLDDKDGFNTSGFNTSIYSILRKKARKLSFTRLERGFIYRI